MSLQEKIATIKADISGVQIKDTAALEAFRIQYLGSKGIVKQLFTELKEVPNEEKRAVGQLLNDLRISTETIFEELKEKLETSSDSDLSIDVTRSLSQIPWVPATHYRSLGVKSLTSLSELVIQFRKDRRSKTIGTISLL